MDDNLRRAFARLNEAFFAAKPGEHFRARARLLMRFGDEMHDPAPDAGRFTHDVLDRMPGWIAGPAPEPTDASQEEGSNFLTVEAFMSAHHVGESLLRRQVERSTSTSNLRSKNEW